MRPSLARPLALLCLALSPTSSLAQTRFVNIEPNNHKFEATPAFGIRAGDTLATGIPNNPEPSIFRLRHAEATLGIYRHELRPINVPFSALDILGRDAVPDFVYPQSYAVVQSAAAASAPATFLSWYGFGKSEELYVDVALYGFVRNAWFAEARLSTVPVAEVDLGAVPHVSLTLLARSVGAAAELELHVFDAEFNAIPRAAADHRYQFGTRLIFPGTPGTYHLAVADHAAASHLPPSPYDFPIMTSVLDHAGAFVCGNPTTGTSVELEVRETFGNKLLASSTQHKVLPYQALWFRLQIDAGQSTGSFCPGDGSATACGCLGPAPLNSGMGCVNSTGRGATVIGTAHLSLSAEWHFTFEDLPSLSSGIGFFSLQTVAATPIGGGLVCIGPGAVRVGPIQANLGGTATMAGYSPASNGFLVGQTVFVQAAYRDNAAPSGCTLNLTSGFSFVVQ